LCACPNNVGVFVVFVVVVAVVVAAAVAVVVVIVVVAVIVGVVSSVVVKNVVCVAVGAKAGGSPMAKWSWAGAFKRRRSISMRKEWPNFAVTSPPLSRDVSLDSTTP